MEMKKIMNIFFRKMEMQLAHNPHPPLIAGMQLRVEVDLQLRKNGSGPVACRKWTCNWDKNGSGPSCVSMMELQLGQNWSAPKLHIEGGLATAKKKRGPNCMSEV